jgi:hypothetical protein
MSTDLKNLTQKATDISKNIQPVQSSSGLAAPNIEGWFSGNFAKLDNFMRKVSLNSPLIKMGILGTAGYFGGKAVAPWISRLLSPNIPRVTVDAYGNPVTTVDSWETMDEESREIARRDAGLLLAGLLTAPTLINNLHFGKPLAGLATFPYKGIEKNNSAWAIPYNPSMPVSYAKDVISDSNMLLPSVKATALSILDTFPNNTQVDSPSIINKAIDTGIDALKGGALGFVTAKALGLPNPMVTAGIFAGINTILK